MADSTHIRVKISGDKDVRQMLHNIGLDVTELRPAMQEVGKYLKDFYSGEVFASRGQVIGERWPRLSEPYASYKARRYRKGILVATGTMQKSFSYSTTNMSATITNTAPHFVYHQSTEPRTKIPRRAMMKLEDGDERYNMVVKIIESNLANKIAQRGGA